MHLTYWTKTKYVYVCDIFVTQYKRNTICFSKPIFKQFAQLSFLSLFLLEKCRDNSKFHEKSSSNHQSYTHTSIYVHIKIKLNRVKKKRNAIKFIKDTPEYTLRTINLTNTHTPIRTYENKIKQS